MDGIHMEKSVKFLDYKTFLFGILLQLIFYEVLAVFHEKGRDVTITRYIRFLQKTPLGRAIFVSLWSWLTYHFLLEDRRLYAPEYRNIDVELFRTK